MITIDASACPPSEGRIANRQLAPHPILQDPIYRIFGQPWGWDWLAVPDLESRSAKLDEATRARTQNDPSVAQLDGDDYGHDYDDNI